MVKPNPRPHIHTVAAESLAKSGHSVFEGLKYKVLNFQGIEVEEGWWGPPIENVTVHEPTNITRSWRVLFWPKRFHAYLDGTLSREEAMQIAENLMELTNIRRGGDADCGEPYGVDEHTERR
jgi:hypothetical protein